MNPDKPTENSINDSTEEAKGLETVNEIKDKETQQLTGADLKSYKFYTDRIDRCKLSRSKQREEFDDMTFELDYAQNKRAMNSYLRAKKNDSEVRVVTGMTEKKIDVVINELISLNMQPEVQAFDKEDNEYVELGNDFSDIVFRTNQIERDDDVMRAAFRELATQRAVFVQEFWNKRRVGFNSIERPEKRLVSALKVFLGDIYLPAYRLDDQPYIVRYNRMSYEECRTMWFSNPNWKYVRPGMPQANQAYPFRMYDVGKNEVELIEYISACDNEYQVLINGAMMFSPRQPLPWKHYGYDMSCAVTKEMDTDFFYGKPLTASAKVLQSMSDEMIRLMIRKWQQAIEPPTGVKNGKILSKDVWNPGTMAQGIKADDFSILINHNGLTPGEFQFYDLISKKTEEFIGIPNQLQGQSPSKRTTATEIMEVKKQAIRNLGIITAQAIKLKRDMTYLRIYTVMEKMTKPIGKKKNKLTDTIENTYRKFSVKEAQFDDGSRGKKIIQFSNQDMSPEEQQLAYDYEEEQTKLGNPLRITTINVEKLKDIELNWYVNIVPKEQEGSALEKAMFTDQLAQAASISQLVQRPLNADRIIESYERKWRVKDFFSKQQLAGPAGGMGAGGGIEQPNGGSPGQQMANGQQLQSPSLNQMAQME